MVMMILSCLTINIILMEHYLIISNHLPQTNDHQIEKKKIEDLVVDLFFFLVSGIKRIVRYFRFWDVDVLCGIKRWPLASLSGE